MTKEFTTSQFPNYVAPCVNVAVQPHTHDCEACIFLGQNHKDGKHEDFYYCRKSGSLIRRFGVDGEYGSMQRSLAIRFQDTEFMKLEKIVQSMEARKDFELMEEKYRNGTLAQVADIAVTEEQFDEMLEAEFEFFYCD